MTTHAYALTGDEIESLYQRQGAAYYGDESISQLEHALQCAWFAEQANEGSAQIVAALLHDIGHLLIEESKLEDRRHQEVAMAYLGNFGPAVRDPIRLHVAAKRYLCAVDGNYWHSLSPASKSSLELQGGKYNSDGVLTYIAQPFALEAVRLRRYDDLAKVPNLATPDMSYYRRHIEMMLEC